ncbi:MAG TPA: hypothetical protein VKA21_03915, partial [Candidatus Binatia bacterium]|nr:hypothetical protein [Candidatus Binatia bacterium]
MGRRGRNVVVAALIAIVAVAFWENRMVATVPLPQQVARWSMDLYEQYVPLWTLAYRGPRLLPRWNPWQLAGTPLLATTTAGFFYPPNLLATVLPVPQLLGWLSAAHLALAGVSTFALGRRLGLGRAAATLAALAFVLSDRVLNERIHTPYLVGVCWLPALLLAAVRVADRPTAGAGALLGVVVALQVLAGYPDIVAFSAPALAAAGTVWLVATRPPARELGAMGGAVAVAVVTALGVAAVQILPTLELLRAADRGSLTLAESMVVPPPPLAEVLRPAAWLLPLAIVAATDARRRLAVALGTLVLAVAWLGGLGTFLYTHVLRQLPGIAFFRLPQKVLPLGELALALLAAGGLQVALDGRRRVVVPVLLTAGALCVAGAGG